MLDQVTADKSQAVMRGLLTLWGEFAASLDQVPIIDKLNRGKFRLDDYRELLRNHRQQVVEGARWIARASSSIDEHWFELRSHFMQARHHRAPRLQDDRAGLCLGRRQARGHRSARRRTSAPRRCTPSSSTAPASRTRSTCWAPCSSSRASARRRPPSGARGSGTSSACKSEQVSFLLYHGENDEAHMQEFEDTLASGILAIPEMDKAILKTAKVVGAALPAAARRAGNTKHSMTGADGLPARKSQFRRSRSLGGARARPQHLFRPARQGGAAARQWIEVAPVPAADRAAAGAAVDRAGAAHPDRGAQPPRLVMGAARPDRLGHAAISSAPTPTT